MKGLLHKELVGMRMYWKFILIFMLFIIVPAFFVPSISNFIFTTGSIFIMLSIIICINSIAYDDSTKWNCYALTMPYCKRDLVRAKYLFALGLILAGVVLPILIAIPASLLSDPSQLEGFGLMMALLFSGAMFIVSVFFPLLYYFGVEKARLFVVITALVPSIGIGALGKMSIPVPEVNYFPADLLGNIAVLFPIAAVALAFLSYLLTVRIFEKKDL